MKTLAVVMLLCAANCASGLDGAKQSLTNTVMILNASTLAFEKFDKAHQEEILKKYDGTGAPPIVMMNAVAKYRTAREPVMKAFAALNTLVMTATLLVPLVDNGDKPLAQLQAVIAQIFNSSTQLQSAITGLGSVGL